MIVQRGIINCFLDVIFLPISSHAYKTSHVGPIICLHKTSHVGPIMCLHITSHVGLIICLHITSVIVTFCLNISNHLHNYGILGIGTECTNAYKCMLSVSRSIHLLVAHVCICYAINIVYITVYIQFQFPTAL